MSFFVDRIEWEYGKQDGYVFYPQNKEEFDDKLRELDESGLQNGYPFYVEIFFVDESYTGIMVGHESNKQRKVTWYLAGEQATLRRLHILPELTVNILSFNFSWMALEKAN